MIRPHKRISSPIQQHDNQGPRGPSPQTPHGLRIPRSQGVRQAWGKKRHRDTQRHTHTMPAVPICVARYYDTPRPPQAETSEKFQPSRASPTCGGHGRRPFFDMCRGAVDVSDQPTHSKRTFNPPHDNYRYYTCTDTHVCVCRTHSKGHVDAICCNGPRATSLLPTSPRGSSLETELCPQAPAPT